MKFLSLETSTQYCLAAVSDERGLLYGLRRPFEKGRSEGLMSLIQECFKKTKTRLSEFDGFGIGVGPGSFTGLRIGLGTLKGLSFVARRPIYTFSSLDAIAFNEMNFMEKRLCVIVDARRFSVYCRFYRRGRGGELLRDSPEKRVDVEAFLKKSFRDTIVSGDGLRLLWSNLKRKGACRVRDESLWSPSLKSISRLTIEAFQKGESVDCFGLKPVYLYEKDCQVNKPVKKHE